MFEYPNLLNDVLPASLPRARYTERHLQHARVALERFCHRSFVVHEVKPLPSAQKPYCQWYVEFYTLNRELLPLPGNVLKTCFKQVMKHKPVNSKIMSRHLVNYYSIAIIYAREPCFCQEPLDFMEATERPKLWLIKNEQSFTEEILMDIKVLFEIN